MTDYARIHTIATYSENSDYSYPTVKLQQSMELTPDEYALRKIDVTNTAYTLDLDAFDSVTGIFLWYRETTGVDVEATWYTQHGTQAAGASGFNFTASGNVLTDATGDTAFITNGAVAGRWVRVSSSTADDGLHLIDTVTNGDNLVISPRTTMSDTAGDTAAALSFESKNCQALAAGQLLVIPDNVVVAGDLVLQSRTAGTVALWVFITGS